MTRFTEFRVRLLAAIAIGLALALVSLAMSRESTSGSSWWHYGSSAPESESVVSVPSEDAGSEDPSAAQAQGTPTPRPGSLLIDGGDFTGPDSTPTPPGQMSPPVALLVDDAEDDDAAARDRGGVSITVPETPTAVGTSDDGMLAGIVNHNGRGGIVPSTPLSDQGGLPWVGGQGRGYAMLYALQPEARAVVEANVSTLLAARVREPYIGVLIDGTFGKDYAYLRELIRRLNTDGRNLQLALYIANGPAQRRYKNPPYDVPFVRVRPEDFRREIRRSNSDTQVQYLQMLSDARMLFEYNLKTNPDARNYAVVMLEDNLERDSFRAMAQLARDQVEAVATIVRNPCPNCYSGNDGESLGYTIEDHSVDRFNLLDVGAGFTLDGIGFSYPSESNGQGVPSDQVVSLATGAYQRGFRYFGLWREEWQGIENGQLLKDPKGRVYVASTAEGTDFEITVLRSGLPLLNSQDGNAISDGTTEERLNLGME